MKTFEILTYPDPDGSDHWIAVSEELGVTTEARSLSALHRRVWQIAPEMAVLNKLVKKKKDVQLRFTTIMSAPEAYVTAAE